MLAYMRLLDQYSLRAMSNPGDIIFAFQGMISALSSSLESNFLAGLPEAYLHEALLWHATSKYTRRKVSVGGSTMTPYPTWSWAGWETSASYNLFIGYVRPEVDWFLLDHLGAIVKIETPGSDDLSGHPKLNANNKVLSPTEPPSTLTRSLKPRTHISTSDGYWNELQTLACWSDIASFRITRESFDLEGHHGTTWESYQNPKILDEARYVVGSVVLEREFSVEMLEKGEKFDFVLISRTNTVHDLEFFDERLLHQREWCYAIVLLISRVGEKFERLGVGIIHEDAWVKADRFSSLVKLR